MQEGDVQLQRWHKLVVLCAATYLAVLSMADTIALRNAAMLAILVLLALRFRAVRSSWQRLEGRGLMVPAVLWMAYLCLFPFFAEDRIGAWHSLGVIWYHSILALLAGAGLALALFGRPAVGTVFQFGLISAVPIVVHLGYVGWKIIETSNIPWNYWGRETHHADLGYAAGQSVILLAVALIAGKSVKRPLACALIAAAIVSLIVAHSRAGLGFALLALFIVLLVHLLISGSGRRRLGQLAILGAVVVVVAGVVAFAARSDVRWQRMTDRLAAGFYGDSLQIECEGNAQVEQELIQRFGSGERTHDLVDSIRDGDGARMVLLRAGLRLAADHPWGLDGSRQAYQKRLRQYCPNPQAFQIAHTHNGWLDTILALGWIGAAIYFLVLANFLRLGISGLRAGGDGIEWAYVLVVLSIFWILRGFTDSVYRDHQLEMQGFVLAYAAVALKLKRRYPSALAAA